MYIVVASTHTSNHFHLINMLVAHNVAHEMEYVVDALVFVDSCRCPFVLQNYNFYSKRQCPLIQRFAYRLSCTYLYKVFYSCFI